MLTSVALVLLMTAPGLAMFYGGLVRKKNVLSVMMQCIFLMGLMTVIWGAVRLFAGVWRRSAATRRSNQSLDRQRRLPVHEGRASAPWNDRRRSRVANAPMDRHDSRADAHAVSGHVLHHHAGADLRRVRRTDEVQHDGRVHDPVGHARLLPAVPLGLGRRHSGYGSRQADGIAGGALDFAGGTVVHISSGVSALICALVHRQAAGLSAASRCRRTT